MKLLEFDFLKDKENIIFIGPPGVGKTHLSIALGVEASKNRIRNVFYTANDLIKQLRIAKVSNTLSEPSILCVNNQESSIYVGQTESILTSSTQGSTTTSLAQNTYSREDIGLTLKIKPRISNDNKVILNIDTTLEDVVAGSGGGLPTTTKREVKTMAVVKDGEAVIVGGLIKDKVTESADKIPLLGDIPLIGGLFRDSQKTIDKINLIIILTPYVIEKASDLKALRDNLQKLSKLEKQVVDKLIKEGLEKKDEFDTILDDDDEDGDLE